MLSKKPCFYYCDEHFSYIQSDIERRIFGMMLDRVSENGQLIFTTHNTDILLQRQTYMRTWITILRSPRLKLCKTD